LGKRASPSAKKREPFPEKLYFQERKVLAKNLRGGTKCNVLNPFRGVYRRANPTHQKSKSSGEKGANSRK